MACAEVAIAAAFVGQHYGAPVLLFALLGMGMNFLSVEGRAHRASSSARGLLRVGVALLGLRITLSR